MMEWGGPTPTVALGSGYGGGGGGARARVGRVLVFLQTLKSHQVSAVSVTVDPAV